MKIKFDVEKRDGITGKRYFPNVEYEMSEEKAKAILSQTKYAHLPKLKTTIQKEDLERAFIEGDDGKDFVVSEEQIVENVENVVENSEKPRKKKAKKD